MTYTSGDFDIRGYSTVVLDLHLWWPLFWPTFFCSFLLHGGKLGRDRSTQRFFVNLVESPT